MFFLYSAILFVALVAGVIACGYYVWLKPAKSLDSLGAAVRPDSFVAETTDIAGPSRVITVLQWIGEKAPKSPQELRLTQRMLFAAGYRSDAAVTIYAGIRLALMTLLAVASYAVATSVRLPPFWCVVIAGVAAWVGSSLPGMVLDGLVKSYRERLRLSLPDALDLLVVCVESGLGLDQSILNVSRELAATHPEISKELSLVSLEMRTGGDRATALRNLADRSGEAELKKFVAVLVQTDRFGTSLADSLRTHSDFMRVRRRNEAEERAGKIGVMLTFPTMLCMMPSIFVVTAGPIVMRIFKELLPALRGTGN